MLSSHQEKVEKREVPPGKYFGAGCLSSYDKTSSWGREHELVNVVNFDDYSQIKWAVETGKSWTELIKYLSSLIFAYFGQVTKFYF